MLKNLLKVPHCDPERTGSRSVLLEGHSTAFLEGRESGWSRTGQGRRILLRWFQLSRAAADAKPEQPWASPTPTTQTTRSSGPPTAQMLP